jgi:probable DNA metabolism protein
MTILYDGTFDGYLTAVFTLYEKKISADGVMNIIPQTDTAYQPDLFDETQRILTDEIKAERVKRGITKISAEAADEVLHAFCHSAPERGRIIYRYLRLLFAGGAETLTMHAHPDRAAFAALALAVAHERHQYKGFTHFRETESGVFYAPIAPAYDILLLDDFTAHFCGRFNSQPFVIHDAAHGRMLVYDGAPRLIPAPPAISVGLSAAETEIFGIWKTYRAAAEIGERRSAKRQNRVLPKRHRKFMDDLAET